MSALTHNPHFFYLGMPIPEHRSELEARIWNKENEVDYWRGRDFEKYSKAELQLMQLLAEKKAQDTAASTAPRVADATAAVPAAGPSEALSQQFKADAGKAMPDLLDEGFPNALRLVQATLEYGAQKYEAHSWRRVPNAIERYTRAGGRHRQDRNLDNLEKGSDAILHSRDGESGLPHIAHELFNLMALIELALAAEVERSGETISAREITQNLVGLMKAPPTGHKIGGKA